MFNMQPDTSVISRPDEIKREAARLARASQAKPFDDPDPSKVIQRDSPFSRITVPSSQLDDMARNVRLILGPYHNVLGASALNAFRASMGSGLSHSGGRTEANGTFAGGGNCSNVAVDHPPSSTSGVQQQHSKSNQPNNFSATASSLGTSSNPLSGDPKRPSVMPVSQNPLNDSYQSSSKSAKPMSVPTAGSSHVLPGSKQMLPATGSNHVLPAIGSSHALPTTGSSHVLPTTGSNHVLPSVSPCTSVSHQTAVPPPSSPVAPKDISCVQQNCIKTGFINNILKVQTKPLSSSPSKVDSSKQQQSHNVQSSSKPVLSNTSLPFSKDLLRPASAVAHNGEASLSAASNKHHQNSKGSLPVKASNIPPTRSPPPIQTSSLPRLSTTLPMTSSSSRVSPSGSSKITDASLSSQSHSGKPARPTSGQPAQIDSKHSSFTVAAVNGPSRITNKAKLTVKMQSERTLLTSDSAINEIMREMADIQDPLTDIDTPIKSELGFQLSVSKPNGIVPLSDIKRDNCVQGVQSPTKIIKSEGSCVDKGLREIKTEDKTAKKAVDSNSLKNGLSVNSIKTAPPGGSSSGGNKSSIHRSIGSTVYNYNSIPRRDLDLSEESDVEQTLEDNPAPRQPTKTMVISPALGAAVKSVVSPMSSSSSSSSDSSSDGSGDEDDEKEVKKEVKKEKNGELKKSVIRRLSSSSHSSRSSSSSEVSSDEDNCVDDDEIDVKTTPNGAQATAAVEISNNAFILGAAASGVVGPQTATVHDSNSESGMIWGLKNFIQPTKKNSISPTSISPEKPASSSMSHSASACVQKKDDSCTPDNIRLLQGHDTKLFESKKVSRDVTPNVYSSVKDEGNGSSELGKNKIKLVICSRKNSKHSEAVILQDSKQATHSQSSSIAPEDGIKKARDTPSDTAAALLGKKCADSLEKELPRRNSLSRSVKNQKKKVSPSEISLSAESSSKTIATKEVKSARTSSGSSSNDDIDVEGFTPENKSNERLQPSLDKSVSENSRLEVCKQLFNGNVSEESKEDSESTEPRGKNAPVHDIKHHKRKHESNEPPVTTTSSSSSSKLSCATSFAATTKPSKKRHLVTSETVDDTETISKPVAQVSDPHSAKSPPSGASSKPHVASQASITRSSPQTSISTMPVVTLSQNSDGDSTPRITVHISNSFLSKKILKWLKDKKERRKKIQKRPKLSESSQHPEASSDPSKDDAQTVVVSDTKATSLKKRKSDREILTTSQNLSSSVIVNSKPSKSSKISQETINNSSVAISIPTSSSPSYKVTKQAKSSINALTSTASSVESSRPFGPSNKSSSRSSSVASDRPPSVASSRSGGSKSPASSPTRHSKAKTGHNSEKNEDFVNGKTSDKFKAGKTKASKRKSDVNEELPKKAWVDKVSMKNGDLATTTTDQNSEHPTSSGSSNNRSSKRSRHSSNTSSTGTNNSTNIVTVNNDRATKDPDNSSLPFNHYLSGEDNKNNSNNIITSSKSGVTPSSSSSVPSNLPPPPQIETPLHSHEHYLARAKEHKRHADDQTGTLAKLEPYLRSGLSYFLAGLVMESGKKESSIHIYNETSSLLKYVVVVLANNGANPELSDRERKLVALMIRLQSYLNHRMYRLKKEEVLRVKKAVESEQAKLRLSSSSTATVITAASANSNSTTTSKPHAPSPHQSASNRNSTRIPSPNSPTPSPAGSVSSQGSSSELTNSKVHNGTASSVTSPSRSLTSTQPQQSYSLRYFNLTVPLLKALDLWDQADAESKAFGDFFAVLDNACGALSFHSDPLVIVRYMKHALRVLYL